MVSGVPDSAKANHIVASICIEFGSFIDAIIRQHVGDVDHADDLFQNVQLHLLKNSMSIDIENIENYLYRTVINCIAEKKRQDICYQTHMEEYVETVGIVQTESAPETKMIDTEETAKMFTLIGKQLTRKEFLVITLRFRDKYQIYEIAVFMHVKVKTVERYISRAFEKLRDPLISKEILAFSGYARQSHSPNHSTSSLASI